MPHQDSPPATSLKRRLPAALLGAFLIVLLAWALWPPPEAPRRGPQSVPVSVAPAVTRDYPLVLATVGRVQPLESVSLRARIDGQVARVLMQEGRAVQAGEVLLRLDDDELRTRLTQAEATLARDAAQLSNARTVLERYQALKEKNYVSEDMLRAAETSAASLAAAVRSARAAVENARLQLSYTVVRAPFAGRVGARTVAPGATVQANTTVLAVINRQHPVQVAFAVPEKYLGALQPLREGRALPVTITAESDATLRVEGQADFIDNAVDTGSGTIQVKATLPNRDHRLVPGAFVQVLLQLATLQDVVTVPATAVQQNGAHSSVYVVEAGKAQLREVTVRERDAEVAVIASGLTAGETVVTDGHLRLSPGAAVQIARATQP